MTKINNIGAFGLQLAQQQCLEKNIKTCEAGLEICDLCPEREQGNKRKWQNDFEKSCQEEKRKTKSIIRSSFCLCCSMLFSAGLISGLFAKSMSLKLVLAALFFCVVRFNSRNKLDGRIVYGGMEKPLIFSLGATMFFLGSLFVSQKMQFVFLAVACFVPGLYYFYRGYLAGPHYGWENYFRKSS